MNSRFYSALLRHPDRYPTRLDERHPHILERIAQLWGTSQIDQYLQELLLDTRGDRQGFAPEVMSDLMYLHGLHVEGKETAPAAGCLGCGSGAQGTGPAGGRPTRRSCWTAPCATAMKRPCGGCWPVASTSRGATPAAGRR